MTSSADSDATASVVSGAPDAHTYYNNAQNQDLNRRNESEILYMRNFNNWIKSNLISEYLRRLKSEQPSRANKINVFDMGCGKGGDQLKWQVGRVHAVTFADLAENLVEVCKQRYYERKASAGYEADFFPLNCTKELIRDKLKVKEPLFDLVSTQFVLHYAFDQYKSANRFLRNAAEFLRVGGYFIGTTVNSCELVERCRQAPNQTITNDVFSVKFDSSIDLNQEGEEGIPLFGAKYHFNLADVVDCPEYLVYFPLLEELGRKHGLKKVARTTFKEYFDSLKDTKEGSFLLEKIKALEYYEPPEDNSNQQRGPPIDHAQYSHAAQFIKQSNESGHRMRSCRTLSKKEWEIAGLYVIFAFQKTHDVKYDGDNDDPIKT